MANKQHKSEWEGEFISEFCNDHNGEIRFLRGIFYDEKDGSEKIMNFIQSLLHTTLDKAEEAAVGSVPHRFAERGCKGEIDYLKLKGWNTHIKPVVGWLQVRVLPTPLIIHSYLQ